MNTRDLVPTEPGEIEHVLYLLQEDLRPEYRRAILEGKTLDRKVLQRLRAALVDLIAPRVPEWDRSDWSDFAHLTANTRYDDWIRAVAVAVATLYHFESIANRRAKHGTDPEDIELDLFPEWGRLRSALIEVALSLTYGELIDEEKRRKRAEAHAAALGDAVAKVQPFVERQGRNTKLPKTEFYISLIEQFPDKKNRALADYIFDNAPKRNDGEAHFYWNDEYELIDRKTNKPVTVDQLTGQIQKARSEHVTGQAKQKVR